MNRKCEKGIKCGASCIEKADECRINLNDETSALGNSLTGIISATKTSETSDGDWVPLTQGNYGKVDKSADGKLIRKTALSDEKGFGKYEVEIATKMGEAGYSPKIISSNKDEIVMEAAPGKTLWKTYRQDKETEPESMNETVGRKAVEALTYLQKDLGFAHGDNHALQYLVDGDNVKMIDFGLSKPMKDNEATGLSDWAKTSKLFGLDRFDDLPISKIVNKYQSIKGKNKEALAAKEEVLKEYKAWLNE